MSEITNNKNDRFSDFLRYKGNEMTNRERNAFERNLQKDPFTQEAAEGLEGTDSSIAEKDVAELRKQIKKRTSQKQRVIWQRIAASIALLMIISSIFVFKDKRKTTTQLSYTPGTQQSRDLHTLNDHPATEIKAPTAVPVEEKAPIVAGPERSIVPPAKKMETKSKIENKSEIKKEEISAENQEPKRVAEVAEPDQVFAVEKAMPAKSARAVLTSDTVMVYNAPVPVNGRAAFDKYILDNLRRPDTTSTGQRVVVVLNFIVNAEGKIDSIRIISSPGKNFSDEAIRLIREGPAWKPAEKNGYAINDEVRIRIVFK
jgi:TonB family protein